MSKRPSRRQQVEIQGKRSRYDQDGDDGGRDGDGGGDDNGNGDGHGEHEPSGEREIFVDMVQRRMGGGAPPSAEAYAKAMQQWRKLPGAVGFVAVPNVPEADDGPSTPGGGSGASPRQGGGKDEGGGP
jgi:hypothetical protein